MTAEQIRAAVQASPELLALAQALDTPALAAALSAGKTTVSKFEGGIGSIMRAIGPDDGGAFLNALEDLSAVSPAVKWALFLIKAATFDFGDELSRQQIVAMSTPLGGSLLTPAQAESLLALAERPLVLSELEVRQAILNDDGSLSV